MECKKCIKKDVEIKELKSTLIEVHKYFRLKNKYLKYQIADVLSSLNHCDINIARQKLKDIGGVQQYHNYPKNKMPTKPHGLWFNGKTYKF
jgi:hypothetical protein